MIDSFQTSLRQDSTSGTIVLGRLIGSSLVESLSIPHTGTINIETISSVPLVTS